MLMSFQHIGVRSLLTADQGPFTNQHWARTQSGPKHYAWSLLRSNSTLIIMNPPWDIESSYRGPTFPLAALEAHTA